MIKPRYMGCTVPLPQSYPLYVGRTKVARYSKVLQVVVLTEEAEERFRNLDEVYDPSFKMIFLFQHSKWHRRLEVVETLRGSTCTVDFQFHVVMNLQEERGITR